MREDTSFSLLSQCNALRSCGPLTLASSYHKVGIYFQLKKRHGCAMALAGENIQP